jgi:hypothetical protein
MVTIFKKEWAPVTAPLYALVEGLFLGAISAHLQPPVRRHRAAGGDADLRHAVRPAVGLPQRPDQGDRELQARRGRGDRRHRLVYLATIVLGLFGINIPSSTNPA